MASAPHAAEASWEAGPDEESKGAGRRRRGVDHAEVTLTLAVRDGVSGCLHLVRACVYS
jgi:hypothetical protein